VAVQWLDVTELLWVPWELDRLGMFGLVYVIGFWYTDGGLEGAPRPVLLAGAACGALATWLYFGTEGVAVNASEPMHLFVGVGLLCVALGFAEAARRLASRLAFLIDWISRRTFTMFLWGWPTCLIAADVAVRRFGAGWDYRAAVLVGSFGLLGLAIAVFGRVEAWSARRPASNDPITTGAR